MTSDARAKFDRRQEPGPFDIIGDVHGCGDELEELLQRLGYGVTWPGRGQPPEITTPPGRRAIFVGDLVDRGPRAFDVVMLVATMCARGQALAVPGNHDTKFRRWLGGRQVSMTHGLAVTAESYADVPAAVRDSHGRFIDELPSYLWLDGGGLVVAHAGIKAHMIGQISHSIENFCLYGDVDHGKTRDGLPIRYNWAAHYDGSALVVYGHTPVAEPAWVNGTVCVDTGCSFGNALSALRYPEREIVNVRARRAYAVKKGGLGLPPARG